MKKLSVPTKEEVLESILDDLSCLEYWRENEFDVHDTKEFAYGRRSKLWTGAEIGWLVQRSNEALVKLRRQVFEEVLVRCQEIADLLIRLCETHFISEHFEYDKSIGVTNWEGEVEAIFEQYESFFYEGKEIFYNQHSPTGLHGRGYRYYYNFETLLTNPDAKIMFSTNVQYHLSEYHKFGDSRDTLVGSNTKTDQKRILLLEPFDLATASGSEEAISHLEKLLTEFEWDERYRLRSAVQMFVSKFNALPSALHNRIIQLANSLVNIELPLQWKVAGLPWRLLWMIAGDHSIFDFKHVFKHVKCKICQDPIRIRSVVLCNSCKKWVDCGYKQVSNEFICVDCLEYKWRKYKLADMEEIDKINFIESPPRYWDKKYDKKCDSCGDEKCEFIGTSKSPLFPDSIAIDCCLCAGGFGFLSPHADSSDLCYTCRTKLGM